MSDTLLLISIGPVQEFIAAARKLRDLWFGSYLLSELSKTVARSLHEQGAELIFPCVADGDVLKEGSELNVANKIMARVGSGEEAAELQRKAKAAWRAHLDSLFQTTLDDVSCRFRMLTINQDLYLKQSRDYGEFYAVWTGIQSAGGYAPARSRVESLLAARKTLREFEAPSWDGAGLEKNSLDGRRESVLSDGGNALERLVRKSERLDAMGCVKRLYPVAGKRLNRYFDDLSDIALSPWLQGVAANEPACELFKEFQASVLVRGTERNHSRLISGVLPVLVNADCLYADEKELSEMIEPEKDGGRAWQARSRLIRKCGSPSLYSVIMLGDGDHMGQMIDAIGTQEGHQAFTRELSSFAGEAGLLVNSAGGSLIYSGGDDVMAYLPLHTAVSCANDLRLRFLAVMEAVHEKLSLDCTVPSFSIGLAIVHHSMPLDQALALARRAERIAKDEGGRNALCIIQSKRSGSELIICGKWDESDCLPGMAERTRAIVSLYESEDSVLPSRLGYQLREARLSTGDDISFVMEDGVPVPGNAGAALVKRIISRKNDGNTRKNAELAGLLAGRRSIRELSDELILMLHVARAVRMASGKEMK